MADYTPAERDEIRVDIEELYRAGRVKLPERAQRLADVADQMAGVIDSVNSRAAQIGDQPALIDVLDMAVDCQAGVARTVTTLNNIAAGVVGVADDFVARDEYARDVFNGLDADLRSGPVPQTAVPDTPDKDRVLTEGDGSEYEANPDVASPDEEREHRDDELADHQSDVPYPEE